MQQLNSAKNLFFYILDCLKALYSICTAYTGSCTCAELWSQQWCSWPRQTAVLHELFCKSFKIFHHFEGFSYTTKYLLQNHFYIALNSFEVQIHWNYHLCWLECRKFKKTNQESQRPGTRSVCHLPRRQGGLNVRVNEFALMNDLVTHYQLLNFVILWVTERNKKDSTSQECSCFIVLVTLAVSYLQGFFLGVRISK